jgi:hypothetical protein
VAAEDFLQDVQVRQSPGDPWLAPLQRVRGKIGDKSIERISTQTLFDCLEVPSAQSRSRSVSPLGKRHAGARLEFAA